jgi:hypothetical protein
LHWPCTSISLWLFCFWWLILVPWAPARRIVAINISES